MVEIQIKNIMRSLIFFFVFSPNTIRIGRPRYLGSIPCKSKKISPSQAYRSALRPIHSSLWWITGVLSRGGGVRLTTHIHLDSLKFAFSVISLTTWYLRNYRKNFMNFVFIIRVITSRNMQVGPGIYNMHGTDQKCIHLCCQFGIRTGYLANMIKSDALSRTCTSLCGGCSDLIVHFVQCLSLLVFTS